MAQSKKLPNGLGMVLLFLLGLLTLFLLFRKKLSTSTAPVQTDTNPVAAIISGLTAAGYSETFAKMWVAVSKFETANFSSRLCVKHNNLFGMSYPTAGKDYGKVTYDDPPGTPHDFSAYPSFKESVADLVEYLAAFKYPKDFNEVADLVSFMKSKNYFGSPLSQYVAGVQRYYRGL